MQQSDQKPIGRPIKPATPGKRASLGLKVNAEIKNRLEAAARANGRTQSQEAEYRLDLTFHDEGLLPQILALGFGPQAAGVMLLIGRIMRDAGPHAGFASTFTLDGASNWLANPYAFDQVVKGVVEALEFIRPEGARDAPRYGAMPGMALDLNASQQNLGAGFAAAILRAVAGEHLSDDLDHAATQIGSLLGTNTVDLIKAQLAR